MVLGLGESDLDLRVSGLGSGYRVLVQVQNDDKIEDLHVTLSCFKKTNTPILQFSSSKTNSFFTLQSLQNGNRIDFIKENQQQKPQHFNQISIFSDKTIKNIRQNRERT